MLLKENWRDIRLTEDFLLGEFVRSNGHPELIKYVFPTEENVRWLYILCRMVLQPVRNKFGRTMPTSGLRNGALNAAVGGVGTSQHLSGRAVDFRCPHPVNMKEVFYFIRDKIKWDGQIILYKNTQHIHVGVPELGIHPTQVGG